VKTDSLFYKIFLEFAEIFFQLINQPVERNKDYKFTSQEVKQLAFRVDGLFLPLNNNAETPFYLVEVQFQPDDNLYYRIFTELFLYLSQYKPEFPWQVVVIYPQRQIERIPTQHFDKLLCLDNVQRISLEELGEVGELPLSLGVLKLIIQNQKEAVSSARILLERAGQEIPDQASQRSIRDLLQTIVIYKLPQKSREEIKAMFSLQDLKQTRFYQEVLLEGKAEEAANLVLRQLGRRFGEIPESSRKKIQTLALENLEDLSEALLDFEETRDLQNWLEQKL
jgi:predicted transposase/invertase (TIGR01784 family)